MDLVRPQASLRTTDLLALGVTPKELRGPRWRTPFRGVHTPAIANPSSPAQRVLDAAELVPAGGAIGGWAAGWLLGATDLDGRGRSGRETEDLVVLVPRGHHPTPRPGIRFIRSDLADDDLTIVDGIVVTNAIRTAFDLARRAGIEDGLVATDVLCRQLHLAPALVLSYAQQHRRLRGSPIARTVLSLTDPRSRSTGESRLRYIWIVLAGLPRPQCNAYVVDENGTVVAMPDLLDDGTGLVAEYDGSSHREASEHTEDNNREESMEGLGLVVVRATSIDVGPRRDRTVTRLQTAAARARAVTTRSWGWRRSPSGEFPPSARRLGGRTPPLGA